MDVSGIVTKLDTDVTALTQVVTAVFGGWTTPVDSSTEIYTQLTSAFATQVYPLHQGPDPTFPSLVYSLMNAQPQYIDGFQITQTDRYELMVRSTTYAEMATLVGTVNTQLAAASLAMEIVDAAYEYQDVDELFVARLLVEVSYLSSSLQTLPAAFVYPIDRSAEESPFDNTIKQQVFNEYGIVIVADSGMSGLLDDVRDSLLGYQQAASWNDIEYVEGRSIDGVAGLQFWREIYRDSQYWQET